MQQTDDQVWVSGCDIDGIARGKILARTKFDKAVNDGFGFCSVVFGWDMHDQSYSPTPPLFKSSHNFGDLIAKIDEKTARRLPWSNVPHYLVDFYNPVTLKPLAICPRSLLKGILAKYAELDLSPKAGIEYEFFNFKEDSKTIAEKKGVGLEPLTQGMFGYSMTRPNSNKEYFSSIYNDCLSYGIPLECFHTETGPGVYEAAIEYADALELADRAHLFKTAVKQIGQKHGVIPCFMAKPYVNQPGCSGHVHFSISDKSGKNAFSSGNSKGDTPDAYITPMMKHFVAGVLAGLPSIMAIFAPTINSYKRLVANYWAPLTVSYGFEHRQTAIRIIVPPVCSPSATRIEVRVPGADSNPYLVIAAVLACGLKGIQEKMQPPVEVSSPESDTSDRPKLARSLQDAVSKMMEPDSMARKVLGDEFVEHFGATRLHEIRLWSMAVTDFEMKRYMETI